MEDYVSRAEHTEFSRRIEQENERQNHRLANLETAINQLNELVSSVKVLAVNVEQIAKEINEQGVRLKEIEGEPAKKWKLVISTLITGIVTAVITYAVSH